MGVGLMGKSTDRLSSTRPRTTIDSITMWSLWLCAAAIVSVSGVSGGSEAAPLPSRNVELGMDLFQSSEGTLPKDVLLPSVSQRQLQDPSNGGDIVNAIAEGEPAATTDATEADHFVENNNAIESMSRLHKKLSTPLDGTVEASGGVVLSVGNRREDGRNVMISGLGLNVKTAETASPCRVKIYSKIEGTNDEYKLALDSSEIRCMGPTVETVVPSSVFLKYYREVYLLENAARNRNLRGGASVEKRRAQFDNGNDAVETESSGSGNTSGQDVDPSTAAVTTTSPPIAEAEAGENYPLLIPPKSVLSLYVVVLPLPIPTSDEDVPYVPPPEILSSAGTAVMAPYSADSSLTLYEGYSINDGLVESVSNGGIESKDLEGNHEPTVFNGAIYYDDIPSDMSVSHYYDSVEYSALPGDALHGLPGCDKYLTTGYTDTVGSYGIMFDLKSIPQPDVAGGDLASKFKDIVLYGMDVYIRNIVNTTIEVYVRNDGIEGNYKSYAHPTGQTLIAENWELVVQGVVSGRGVGVATPIPQEAWLKQVVIEHGKSVGLYVTVKDAPDLRYRSSTISEGGIFSSDGILGVGTGRSWGEYPLKGDGSDIYFDPREFSGGFKYHAHEGICDSPAPSVAPSVSLVPTIEVSEPYNPNCPTSASLTTTFHGGTGSHGVIFDIFAKRDLTVTGIDLNIDWNSGDSAQILIYAKNETWFNFQEKPEAWTHILVDTTIYRPADFHNSSTDGPSISLEDKIRSAVVPESAFTSLPMKLGETWGLYVCISNADLRYTLGSSIGNMFASNSELGIMEGAGAADFPPLLSEVDVPYTFYAPRIFNGNLRYDFDAECPSQAPSEAETLSPTGPTSSLTSVKYTFYVEHNPDKLNGAITNDVEVAVRNSINVLLRDGSSYLYYNSVNDGLVITSVAASIISPTEIGYLCIPSPPHICTPISVAVEAWHLSTATSEEVTFSLLKAGSAAMNNIEGYTLEYVGEKAVETDSEITLSGVPAREMEGTEEEFFASVIQDFLNEQVSTSEDEGGLQILSVTVNGQEIIPETGTSGSEGETSELSARDLLSRRLKNANKVKVSVKGKYKPPPEIDFGAIVEDSINAEPDAIVEKLSKADREGGGLGESESTSGYFEEAEVVGAREIKEVESDVVPVVNDVALIEESTGSKGLLNMAAGAIGGLIALLSAIFFLRPRRRKAIFGSKADNQEYLGTQSVGTGDENRVQPFASSFRSSKGSSKGRFRGSGSSMKKDRRSTMSMSDNSFTSDAKAVSRDYESQSLVDDKKKHSYR